MLSLPLVKKLAAPPILDASFNSNMELRTRTSAGLFPARKIAPPPPRFVEPTVTWSALLFLKIESNTLRLELVPIAPPH